MSCRCHHCDGGRSCPEYKPKDDVQTGVQAGIAAMRLALSEHGFTPEKIDKITETAKQIHNTAEPTKPMNEKERMNEARECGMSQMRLGMMACGYSQPEIDRVTEKAREFHAMATSTTVMMLCSIREFTTNKNNN